MPALFTSTKFFKTGGPDLPGDETAAGLTAGNATDGMALTHPDPQDDPGLGPVAGEESLSPAWQDPGWGLLPCVLLKTLRALESARVSVLEAPGGGRSASPLGPSRGGRPTRGPAARTHPCSPA